jgi:hypothetical protein
VPDHVRFWHYSKITDKLDDEDPAIADEVYDGLALLEESPSLYDPDHLLTIRFRGNGLAPDGEILAFLPGGWMLLYAVAQGPPPLVGMTLIQVIDFWKAGPGPTPPQQIIDP